jgi:hypothetical protein
MSALATRLERVIKSLPPDRAASVEKLVWDVIEIVEPPECPEEARGQQVAAHQEHIRRTLEEASALDWSTFKRPWQGNSEKREDW